MNIIEIINNKNTAFFCGDNTALKNFLSLSLKQNIIFSKNSFFEGFSVEHFSRYLSDNQNIALIRIDNEFQFYTRKSDDYLHYSDWNEYNIIDFKQEYRNYLIDDILPKWRNWLKRIGLRTQYPSGKRCEFESHLGYIFKRLKKQ